MLTAAALTITMVITAACSSSGDATITVLAASSLTEVFDELIDEFNATAAGDGVKVSLVLGGSSSLATQLEEGAPGDVVATADTITMARIVATERVVDDVRVFATNSLVLAVEPGNPLGIHGLADLAKDNVLVALCAPQVPCGALTGRLLSAENLVIEPATLEPSVRAVLTKVDLGEVDAALVYRTDVNHSDVVVIEPERARQFTNDYPIAALSEDVASLAFVDFVLSSDAADILASAGFGGSR